MMATEATVGGPVDVSVNEPSLNQPTSTESSLQNGSPLNVPASRTVDDLENKQITEIVDELVNSAEASVSDGSDTEAFKADPTKSSSEKGHLRSSSTVKKPQSFKSVSVNRTFLASKSATGSASRPESAAGSTSTTPQPTVSSSASRLKLVAKSGSNLGGASKTLSVNGKSGVPDPSLVWNRNRAPVQPDTKKRSDEELKHDGIHLADRLGPEDLKGQSNWADIDDDDEWAPDTITWGDGTKITLPPADEVTASPVAQPALVDKVKKDPILVPKSKSPAPVSSASGSPSIKHGVLASGKGLVLKGAPEKPTLVAKPPAPTGPAKSPWATLPPVDKVSPVVMELPGQAPLSRYPLRDASNAKSATPPPPTKEIAADDFSRNYRDSQFNTNRELFNSQSGRYEPVSDRRGSRHDIYARQPALLHRQGHNEQQGPAEPSAAFQTSRNSVQEGPYGRRRGSSNVSGGSGHLAHRIGGKPHDMPPPVELGLNQGSAPLPSGASVPGSVGSPVISQVFPANNLPPNQRVHPPPYQPLLSPHQTHAVPYQNTYNQEPPQAGSDVETLQKEIMKQKREEARRRRLDQEEREEAAKKARIAEKLKALGPAPERKSAKKDIPSVIQKTEIPAALAVRSKTASDTKSATDTMPHGTDSDAKVDKPAAIDSTSKEAAEPDSHVTNGPTKPPMDYDQPRMPSAQSVASTHGQSATSWSEASQQPDRFPAWTGGHKNTSRNVWGAPGNDRSLGNGTFNADIGPLPDSHVAPGTNLIHRPAPIAPPRPTQASQSEAQSNRLPPIGPPRAQPNPANAWNSYDAQADDERRRVERIKQREVLAEKASGPIFTDTWRSVDLNGEGKRSSVGTYAQSHREPPADLPEVDRTASQSEVGRPAAGPPSTPAPPTGPSAQTRTGSRFFPSKEVPFSTQPIPRSKSPTPPPPTADGHPVYDGDATKPLVALPPMRPRVKLPPSAQSAAPGPIAPPSKPAPVTFAAAAAGAASTASNTLSRSSETSVTGRPVSRGRGFNGIPQKPHEIASQENWQSKINNLMGKKSTSPAKYIPIGSMADSFEYSRSHDHMDVPILSPAGSDSTDDSAITTKEMAEECFGEQEMGSLPAVLLPVETPDAAWQAVKPNWIPTPTELRVSPSGCEPFKFSFDYVGDKSVIRISAPGMAGAKTVDAPLLNPRSGSNPRRAGPRTGSSRHPARPSRRGGRDPVDHAGDHSTTSSSSRAVSSRTERRFRPRGGEPWGRHAPSTSAAQS
ncbi:hypothetical protein F5B22DRAFT_496480 [Xylaria bambusicola]|uniref:uncharacterized protein n=1 Tax=Xylaria bambusicola TaxID=326684 RepID=UPI002008A8A4|nr:uncharacterized protein F5B22DRAFT_496480 [Xylaria bambusicola]KAI0505770.1 hypothetical protein F5B22DRAFT_496480 [Xylaria bambusicola]